MARLDPYEMNLFLGRGGSQDLLPYAQGGFSSQGMMDRSRSSYDQAPRSGINTDQLNRNVQNTINAAQAAKAKADEGAAQNAAFEGRMDQIVKMADPFSAQRGQYQQQLSDLLNDPSGALAKNPFFKASAEQGQEAGMRRLRQMGMGDSGNAALELQKGAQANLADQYMPMAQMLGNLSGAQFSPAAASGAMSDMLRLRESQRQFELGPSKQRGFTSLSSPYGVGGDSKVNLSSFWGGGNSQPASGGFQVAPFDQSLWDRYN